MTTHKMLEDYIDRPGLAAALGVSVRTIATYERLPNGRALPFLELGGKHLYHPETVTAWLRSREKVSNPPRTVRAAPPSSYKPRTRGRRRRTLNAAGTAISAQAATSEAPSEV